MRPLNSLASFSSLTIFSVVVVVVGVVVSTTSGIFLLSKNGHLTLFYLDLLLLLPAFLHTKTYYLKLISEDLGE